MPGLRQSPLDRTYRGVNTARRPWTNAPTAEIAAAATSMTPHGLPADILVCPLALKLQEPIVLVNIYIDPIHCTPFSTAGSGPSPASTTGGRPVLMFVGTFMPVRSYPRSLPIYICVSD